jgi:hypothetical protein
VRSAKPRLKNGKRQEFLCTRRVRFACNRDEYSRDGTSQLGRNQGCSLEIDGRLIFLVQTSVGGRSPEECAEKIQRRILNIFQKNDIRKKMKRETLRISLSMLLN